MTDLLTPEDVRQLEEAPIWPHYLLERLARDYLTLYARVKHLEKTIEILDKTRGLKRA